MKDNFDLKKYLKENKVVENYNPFTSSKNSNTLNEGNIRDRVKEMIIKELEDYQDYDEEGIDMGLENPEDMFDDVMNLGDTEDDSDLFGDDLDLFEAEEEEEEVDEEETTEEEPELPADEEGDLESVSGDMEGDDSEIMNSLMSALKIAKSSGNEKLTTQISNTIKFYVSEYIGGEE
jgi:hypothetical protein